jgi:glucose-6-phosphate isomerase
MPPAFDYVTIHLNSLTEVHSMQNPSTWKRFQEDLCGVTDLGITLDISRMGLPPGFIERMTPLMQKAFTEMEALEQGAIANPDEDRMVGHYWLRTPELAPSLDIALDIGRTFASIRRFAAAVHDGRIRPQKRNRFKRVLSIGIGGSALGPQLVSDALSTPRDRMDVLFLDNTDPDGFDRIFARLGPAIAETLCVIISKSGGTAETRNGMLETMNEYRKARLSFARHAVAITGVGSTLFQTASSEGWLSTFPMWDWVGGRTSITSAVGLLPMALQGISIKDFLAGASLCDRATRSREVRANPAALLALAWFHATAGKGTKDMVILPYKDRLQLFARYLQQLVMESLGKEHDREGAVVNQGIAVYGNKGTTDQHAYVQQLREGVNNFFVTFIEVLRDRARKSPNVDRDVTSGDFLSAFLQGTRDALTQNGRSSLTVTLEALDARSLAALIALYERSVGLYASLVNINAYHQPGVEAGKKMAGDHIALQRDVIAYLHANSHIALSAEQISQALHAEPESVFRILEHLSANRDHNVIKTVAGHPAASRYRFLSRSHRRAK